MTPLIALMLLQALPATAGSTAKRYDDCAAQVKSDPVKAADTANAWRVAGGGVPASLCLGLAFVAQERWAPAAAAFEQAAREAEIQRDGRAAALWVQAGNAALAGGDPAKARGFLDRALALPVLKPLMRGEAYLDRARAQVGVGYLDAARKDLDDALKLVPADPLAWLLSANLARRQSDLVRARADITQAVKLDPADPSIAFEQGNVLAATGDTARAREAWQRAVTLDPDSDGGQAAALAIAGKTETAP